MLYIQLILCQVLIFLRENRNILICWSYIPCCAFYLCDTNSHEITKTSDYFRLHWKSRIKLSCGPAEDSALFFPSKSFEISVFFAFKTVKVFWIEITKQLPFILAVHILAYFPYSKKYNYNSFVRNKQKRSSQVNPFAFHFN